LRAFVAMLDLEATAILLGSSVSWPASMANVRHLAEFPTQEMLRPNRAKLRRDEQTVDIQ
jgi:hypothetical protein